MSGRWTMWLRVTVIAMLASMGVAAWSVLDALEDKPLPDIEQSAASGDVERTGRTSRPRANIAAAVDVDPFNPDRKRPDQPYRLPGEPDPTESGGRNQPRSQQLRLIGTIVFIRGGGFVTCQIGNQPPQIVHIGQQIGTYTLKSIERGQATFTGAAGETLQLSIPQTTTQGR